MASKQPNFPTLLLAAILVFVGSNALAGWAFMLAVDILHRHGLVSGTLGYLTATGVSFLLRLGLSINPRLKSK